MGAMSFVNVTAAAGGAGACARGDIEDADKAQARKLSKPARDRKRSVDITTSQKRLPRQPVRQRPLGEGGGAVGAKAGAGGVSLTGLRRRPVDVSRRTPPLRTSTFW